MQQHSEALYDVVTDAVTAAEHLSTLMRAVNAVIGLMDGKVRAAQREWSEVPDGSVRRLTADVERLAVVVLDLNRSIADMMSATRTALALAVEALRKQRDEESQTEHVLVDLKQTLQLLECAELTLSQNDRRVVNCIEAMQAISQRSELASEVGETVRDLMCRMKRRASAA